MARKKRLLKTERLALVRVSEELDVLYNHFGANDIVIESQDTSAAQLLSVAVAAVDTILHEY